MYASDTNRLITLDPSNGHIQSNVGYYGTVDQVITSLAFNPTTGVLYGLDEGFTHRNLVTLSTETGRLTPIGPLNVPGWNLSGLAWSEDGAALFGIDWGTGGLYSIDPLTGNATFIGRGASEQPLDLATDPATGALLASEWNGFQDVTLARVDPSTGARSVVALVHGADELEGIAFAPDSMGTRYCVSGVNSTGGPARIHPWGSTSASAANLRLRVESVPDRSGVFLHGPGTARRPFGNGTLCVGGALVRGATVLPSGGQAEYVYDASDAQHSLGAFAGTTRHFQYWFRDPAAGGARFDASDAITIVIRP